LPLFIFQELVAPFLVSLFPADVKLIHPLDGLKAVVEQVTVQVAVAVEIKKNGMSGVAPVVQAKLLRSFCKGEVAVIDKKLIFFVASRQIAGVANVNVQ